MPLRTRVAIAIHKAAMAEGGMVGFRLPPAEAAADAALALVAEAMRDDRMICLCGTVSSDGECTCTMQGEARSAEPYVPAIIASMRELVTSERLAGRHPTANALEWCFEEIDRLRSQLPK